MKFKNFVLLVALTAVSYLLMTRATPKSFSEIGADAYIYGYPAVLMDKTKEVMTNTREVTETKAPVNQFLHSRTFPTAEFKDVVSPNADTLYSTAWLDLTKEPIILTVPEIAGRYYLMPMLDLWTNVFATPGTRTTGTGAGAFAILGPNWNGALPEGVKSIRAPTNTVWIIGRTETRGPQDYPAVHRIQDQYKLIPLSAWRSENPVSVSGIQKDMDESDSPEKQVEKMEPELFLEKLNQLLQPTAPGQDFAMLQKLATLGVGPERLFDYKKFSDEEKKELAKGIQEAKDRIKNEWISQKLSKNVNNWHIMDGDLGSYGTNYFTRAVVAYGGLGANLPQDAMYPVTRVDSEGRPLNGKNMYVIHFEKDGLPEVNGFWSLTAYNDEQRFMENPIGRYAIGDRDQLKLNEDGSLNIFIQNEYPGEDKESNWLPVGKEDFNLVFRLYGPSHKILDGTWKPPLVERRT